MSASGGSKPRIAHLAGPNATIQNTPPLVTSNKAREQHGLPLLRDVDGEPSRFDSLRPQRLAAVTTLYVEQFTAHPLEADAADLYAPPDGYLDAAGLFSPTRRADTDVPVYCVEVRPEDGLYPLPFMGRQRDGSAWNTDGAEPRAPRAQTRQPFMPDGRRLFEETDRFGVRSDGRSSAIHDRAEIEFFRVAPSGGYTKGIEGGPPERAGQDFFPYRPPHLAVSPSRAGLAAITNRVRRILGGGSYDGALWTQGSPRIEETLYWFNLVLDTPIPFCGTASQRYHGEIGADGPRNLADAVDWVVSRAWADAAGRCITGAVLIQDQRVFGAREVAKTDARPGGYVATGGCGGILGVAGGTGGCVLRHLPATRHTVQSELRLPLLPDATTGIRQNDDGTIEAVSVPLKRADGDLLPGAIPKVSIVKDCSFAEDDEDGDPAQEVDIAALIAHKLGTAPLAGFVLEGLSPYGKPASASRARALEAAVLQGFPVVMVGRGNTEGFALRVFPFIGGSNLSATKARMLLMLCIMKFGMLPQGAAALREAVSAYQAVFDTH